MWGWIGQQVKDCEEVKGNHEDGYDDIKEKRVVIMDYAESFSTTEKRIFILTF